MLHAVRLGLRTYRLPLFSRGKTLRARMIEKTMDLIQRLSNAPRSPMGVDVMIPDFPDRPDRRSGSRWA